MKIGKFSVSESTGNSFNRYVGVSRVKVLAVNPKKEELEKLYDTTLEKEPEYLSKTTIDGKEYDQVRLDFIVQQVPFTNNGVEVNYEDVLRLSFYLVRKVRLSQSGKVQVCNTFGETTWVTKEELDSKTCSMSWFDTTGMRACYQGEEELINFVKAYLNIPAKSYRDNAGNVVNIDNVEDAYCQLDSIAEYFKGNFKELQEICKLLPEANLKVMLGVKTAQNGNLYQDFYNKVFVRGGSNNYTRLLKAISDSKEAGSYPNTEFFAGDVQVYQVTATEFKQNSTAPSLPQVNTTSDDELPF